MKVATQQQTQTVHDNEGNLVGWLSFGSHAVTLWRPDRAWPPIARFHIGPYDYYDVAARDMRRRAREWCKAWKQEGVYPEALPSYAYGTRFDEIGAVAPQSGEGDET